MKSWIDYWNSDHPIYVNDRHKSLHAAAVGRDILRHVTSVNAVVLDHGCGEALYAEDVAQGCGKLILCEAAPTVREKLAQRMARNAKVNVIGADDVAALSDNSLDLVVANSLLQYLTRDELAALLNLWRVKLKSDGRLVIADVIPPNVNPVTDATALLRFAWKGGFLVPAFTGLIKTALSDYSKIRSTLGFSTYQEADFIELLAQHGLKATRIHPNFGHNQARMTFSAQRTS